MKWIRRQLGVSASQFLFDGRRRSAGSKSARYVDLQEALDAPTLHTVHFPSSFYPRKAFPGKIVVESRMPDETIAELKRRGHEVQITGDYANGKVMGIRYLEESGVITGAASAKNKIGYAIGW